MSVLNRMKLWQKLAALVLVLSVPMIFLGVFHFATLNAEVRLARDALDGIHYTKALGAMLSEVSTHRSRMREARATDAPAAREALKVSDKKLDGIVAEVDQIDGSAAQKFELSQQWQAIRSRWVDLKTNQDRMEMAEASNRHDAMLDLIMKHVKRVSLRSGLSREPDISTAVAIQLATEDMPHALLAFGNVRRYVNLSIIENELTPERRTRIMTHENDFKRYLDHAREGVQDTTDETSTTLQPAIERAEAAFTTYDAFIRAKVLNAERFEIQTAEAYRASREPTAALSELSNAAYITANTALEDRVSAMMGRRAQTIVVIGLALGFAVILMGLITRSLTRPMNQAISTFHAIAAGMYDNRIEYTGTDEASQVLQSLDQLQRKLRTEVAGGLSQATSELRIKNALDKAHSRIVLADENLKIIYVNLAMQQFLFESRSDLRRDLPRLDIDHIVGSNLEGLFKNQASSRRVIQDSTSHNAELTIGDRALRLAATAVIDPDGKRIGTMVELLDKRESTRTPAAAVNA